MADTRRISITEALVELKLYDSKITKAIHECEFIGSKKKSSDRVGHKSVENFNKLVKSSYQSVTDLIANRAKLKSAIVQSNAITKVKIVDEEYTVAEAIERKSSIEYDEFLLRNMQQRYSEETALVTKENKKVDAQVDKMLESFLGKDSDKKVSETDLTTISDPYRAKNEYELVDPLDLYEEIQKLEDKIDKFKSNVDVALSISNSITYIEV